MAAQLDTRYSAEMSKPRVMVLRAAGTNCDLETVYAWELAGATTERVHLRRLIEHPSLLAEYQILTIPGGFSFGDDIAAGRIFASRLDRHLGDDLLRFVDAGGLVLGICNGMQILVKAGLLPEPLRGGHWSDSGVCSVTHNEPPGFQDRWVTLRASADTPCVFVEPGRKYEVPIAHGEGRVVFSGEEVLRDIERQGLNAVCYAGDQTAAGTGAGDPRNPNGSAGDIAGLCDPTGRIFGLMPHPERHVVATQHPCWTSRVARDREAAGTMTEAKGDGLAMFERAVGYLA
jgi:phosphoribosylformylglycinamidine synthase